MNNPRQARLEVGSGGALRIALLFHNFLYFSNL
jgi:hypothetical protein